MERKEKAKGQQHGQPRSNLQTSKPKNPKIEGQPVEESILRQIEQLERDEKEEKMKKGFMGMFQ